MKSEERHQLHQNELAGTVDRVLKKVEPYSNQILIGILVAAVAAIGISMWMRASGGASEEAWRAFAKADAADSFKTVADEHPNTPVAKWALLRAAEQYLNQGIQTATSDRKATEDNLKRAEETLQALLNSSGGVLPQIRERALYAMAVCRETLSSGDTTGAIKAYQELLDEFPQSTNAVMAQQRIEALKSEKTQEFYAWFDKQPRKPEDRPKPKELLGPNTGSADPFVTPEGPQTTTQNPDRPPSPSTPERPGDGAAPFPGAGGTPPSPAVPVGETPAPTDGKTDSANPTQPTAGDKSAVPETSSTPTAGDSQKPAEPAEAK